MSIGEAFKGLIDSYVEEEIGIFDKARNSVLDDIETLDPLLYKKVEKYIVDYFVKKEKEIFLKGFSSGLYFNEKLEKDILNKA